MDSSTVMTPSLPTFSMTSAMRLPISASAAEMVATCAICSLVVTGMDIFLICLMRVSTPFSMPFLMERESAPAAMFLKPPVTSACASTVAVVVPSPHLSLVLLAASLTSCAPMFSKGSLSSISLAMETPSLITEGAPHFLSRATGRPVGPRVTLTALARASMPALRDRLASSP